MELAGLTAHEARSLLDAGEITSVELTAAVLNRIEQVEGSVKAFVTVTDELAMQTGGAMRIERIRQGRCAAADGRADGA